MANYNINFSDKSGKGSIILYENPLKKGGLYARMKRDKVDMNTLIARISERNKGTDGLILQQACSLFKQAVIQALRNGETVDLMDLGNLYIVPKGTVRDGKLELDEKRFSVRFTPSRETQLSVENLQVESTSFASLDPVITSVTDTKAGLDDGLVSPGKTVVIKGERLRTGGEGSGVFFCPLMSDESDAINPDESTWLACDTITRNTNKLIEFYVPEGLPKTGSYRILLRTSMSKNGQVFRSARETLSDKILTVRSFR